MTILVDARALADPMSGGVARVARGLLPALVRAMPETHFVFAKTGFKPADRFSSDASRFTLHALRLPNKLWSAACFTGLASFDRAFAKEKPDLLFLPNIGFVGRPKIPYALIVHDISFLIEPRWFSRKARFWHHAVRASRLIRNATHLFAVSARTKQDCVEVLGIPDNRITVIPLGLSNLPPTAYHLPPPLEDRRFILALGASDTRKNAACVIAAFDVLRRDPRFSDLVLVLTGVTGASRSAFRAGVLPLGRPSDAALATLYAQASAFLYPSWYEGFGLPLHEAARFGTPCIASTAGALPETAPAGTLFAPPAKPHLWAATLADILDSPDRFRTSTSLGDWNAAGQIVSERLRH